MKKLEYNLVISHYLSLTDVMEEDEFITIAKDYIDIYLYIPFNHTIVEISINGSITSHGTTSNHPIFDLEVDEVESIRNFNVADKKLTQHYFIADKSFYEMIDEIKKVFKEFVNESSIPKEAVAKEVIAEFELQISTIPNREEFNFLENFETFRLAHKMNNQLKEKINSQKMKI